MRTHFKVVILATLLLVVGAFSLPSQGVHAASNNYSGDITGAATWDRPFADGTCCSGLGPVTYQTQEMHVDADGTYSFNSIQNGWDGYLFVYIGSFDPLNQTVNFVKGDDDGNGGIGTSDFDADLVANTTYIIVMTAFANGDEGTFTNTVTGPGNVYFGNEQPVSNETAPSIPVFTRPDNRLNWQMGDTEVVLYPGRDDAGNPTMQVYCVNVDAAGYLAMVVTADELAGDAPATNTLVASSDVCRVELWVLAAGSDYAYQLNLGPNKDGNVTELLFDDISGADMLVRYFNLYELGN